MTKNDFAPVTPGEMLKEEFLAEYDLSQNQLAKAMGISPNRIALSLHRQSLGCHAPLQTGHPVIPIGGLSRRRPKSDVR